MSIVRSRLALKTLIMPLRPLFTINNSIVEALKSHEVFDEVLPAFEPKGLLQVNYGGEKEVALGNTLPVSETQHQPQFQFLANVNKDETTITESDLFTLVLTDPDAPSKTDKKWSEFAHFVKSDIKLKSSADGEITAADLGEQGNELLSYMGPGPPQGTGKHRYVFLLFKQTGTSPKAPADRPNWGFGTPATGVLKWGSAYRLEPWAVNFFYAENKG